MKKTWWQTVKESFTRTREERYAELSKGQQRAHQVFVGFVILIILLMWAYG